jgi:hypothetical protein
LGSPNKKIYEVDPLICAKCSGKMKVIAVIEDAQIIKKILNHLDLWDLKVRPPPKAKAPSPNIHIDYSNSQLPPPDDYLYTDMEYPEVISA